MDYLVIKFGNSSAITHAGAAGRLSAPNKGRGKGTHKYFLPFWTIRAPSPPVAVPVLLVVVEVGGRVLVVLVGGLPVEF